VWEAKHPQARKLTESLGRMICLDFQPFKIVEDVGFKKFTHDMEPRYKLPSRQYLSSSVIPSLYDHCANLLTGSISKATAIALTTDMWTSISNDSYMSVTTHYLTPDFTMEVKCLNVQYFPENHTANNIAVALEESIKLWIKSNKSSASETSTGPGQGSSEKSPNMPIFVVSDNAANVVAAMRQLPSYVHIPCFIHSLQLVINKCIANTTDVDLQSVLKHCKKVISTGVFRLITNFNKHKRH
jgi:hypothetical protein